MLILFAIHEHQFTWRFFAARQQGTQHHGIGACHHGFGNITGILQTTIGNQWHIGFRTSLGSQVDRGNLGYPHPGNYAGGTDRTGTYPDFHRIYPGINQCLRALGSSHVAADNVNTSESGRGFQLFNHLQGELCAPVGGIDYQHVHFCLRQGFGAFPGISPISEGGSYP